MLVYFVSFIVCLLVVGVTMALLIGMRTPRYRTEPEHLLQLFERVLNHQASETEWNALVGYPIRHDDSLEAVRRNAQGIIDDHGRPWQVAQGGCLLSRRGRRELTILRDNLVSRVLAEQGKRSF